MSYLDKLEKTEVAIGYMLVLKPVKMITDWTNVSGNLYSIDWNLGPVSAVEYLNYSADVVVTLTEVDSSPSSNERWWHDYENQKLYINISGSLPFYFRIKYELHLSSVPVIWYRSPRDSTTREVEYQPILESRPTITQSTADHLYGFMPTFTNSLTVDNTEGQLLPHLKESSFSLIDAEVYQFLDVLNEDNLSLLMLGYANGATINDDKVSINIRDRNAILESKFSVNAKDPESDDIKLSGGELPALKAFGRIQNTVAVQYVPSTGSYSTGGLFTPRLHVDPIPSSVAATKTYLDANLIFLGSLGSGSPSSITVSSQIAAQLSTGDVLMFWDSSGMSSVVNRAITSIVGTTVNFASVSLIAATTWVHRVDVRDIKIVASDNTITTPTLNTHYRIRYPLSLGTHDFTKLYTIIDFDSGYSIALGSQIRCTLYGDRVTSSSDLPANLRINGSYGTLCNPVAVIYWLMQKAGVSQVEFDEDSFVDMAEAIEGSDNNWDIGMRVPVLLSGIPSYKELIDYVCRSHLLKLYFKEGKWYITRVWLLDTPVKTLTNDDLTSYSASLSYTDIYNKIQVGRDLMYFRNVSAGFLYSYKEDNYTYLTQRMRPPEFIDKVSKTLVFDTPLMHYDAATALTYRVAWSVSFRRQIYTISGWLNMVNLNIGDTIKIKRDKLPGYSYEPGTDNEVSGIIISKTISGSTVTLEVDDQFGLESMNQSWVWE